MSRTISVTLREALAAQETDEVPIILITINHDDLAEPIRVSSDPTQRLTSGGVEIDPPVYGTVSRGDTFTFLPMRIILPDDKDQSAPTARLEIDNVGRETIALLRSTTDPASVQMELVLGSDLDTVEIEFPALDLTEADYDIGVVGFSLSINPLITEPFPAHRFNPSGFAGLFQ